MLKLRTVFFLLSFSFFLFSCVNERQEPQKGIPGHLYFDFSIRGDEESGQVTVLLQFRDGGREGNNVAIEPPGQVLLDGKELRVDSSRLGGTFYETGMWAEEFAGEHEIHVKTAQGREIRERFGFTPFQIGELPATLSRQNFLVPVKGLKAGDRLLVVLTDMDFESNDLNRLDTVGREGLGLSPYELSEVKSGPVVLQLVQMESHPLRSNPGGGRLQIEYSVMREFELVD